MQDECPYCGCDALTPVIIKRMRIGSALIAVLGMMSLAMMSYFHDLPKIKAGRITPMMNSARVCVEGVVERDAYVSRKDDKVDYLSFYINDGTGSIRVSAYSDVAIDTSLNRLPKKNDRVEVSGRLRIVSGKPSTLRLNQGGLTWKSSE